MRVAYCGIQGPNAPKSAVAADLAGAVQNSRRFGSDRVLSQFAGVCGSALGVFTRDNAAGAGEEVAGVCAAKTWLKRGMEIHLNPPWAAFIRVFFREV